MERTNENMKKTMVLALSGGPPLEALAREALSANQSEIQPREN